MAAQASNIREIENYTQTISANVTNLLSEVARLSAIQTAPPPPPSPPPPPQTNTINNIHINDNSKFDEILCQLKNITSELTGLRQDVDAMKAQLGQDCSSGNVESEQRTTDITKPNLEELMELKETWRHSFQPKTAEGYNKIARRYNSGLRDFHEFLAPLHNSKNESVFGFPGTVGELLNLNPTAAKLLCGAFGLHYTKEGQAFATFCGVDCTLLPKFDDYEKTGSHITYVRVINRDMRARDIATAGDPTPETRRAAALHNSIARKRNAAADNNVVIPLHDGRDLKIPGFPPHREWFLSARRADVLWLMGELGLDGEQKGCLGQFMDFIGLPRPTEGEDRLVWLI